MSYCGVMEDLYNKIVKSKLTKKKQKAAADHLIDKHHEGMNDVEDIFKVLKEKHGSSYMNPHLCLRAHMIEAGNQKVQKTLSKYQP